MTVEGAAGMTVLYAIALLCYHTPPAVLRIYVKLQNPAADWRQKIPAIRRQSLCPKLVKCPSR